MSKRTKQNVTDPSAKKTGRSYGKLVIDPVLGDKTTQKILSARKSNNPERYENV